MTKIQQRLNNLESTNGGLFFKNETLRREFKAIKFDVMKMEAEQASYEASLRAEIERIKAFKPWKRFFNRAKLLWNLIGIIEDGFKDKV